METNEKLITLTHPGEHLLEAMNDWGLTQYRLAKSLGVQQTRVMEIVKGRRAISADTALRLGRLFDTSPEYWMNLQKNYDLAMAMRTQGEKIDRQVKPLLLKGRKVS